MRRHRKCQEDACRPSLRCVRELALVLGPPPTLLRARTLPPALESQEPLPWTQRLCTLLSGEITERAEGDRSFEHCLFAEVREQSRGSRQPLCIVLPRSRPRNWGEKLHIIQEFRPGASQIVPQDTLKGLQGHRGREEYRCTVWCYRTQNPPYSALRRTTSLAHHGMQGWETHLLSWKISN